MRLVWLWAALSVTALAEAGEGPRAIARLSALEEHGTLVYVRLDARGSWDPAGRRLEYSWNASQPGGSSIPLRAATSGPVIDLALRGDADTRVLLTAKAGGDAGTDLVRLTLNGAVVFRDALQGEKVRVSMERLGPVAADQAFVQLYIGLTPLSPNPVPLSADGTAHVTSVTFTAGTTTGTVMTLEQVRPDGQFFTPRQVLRTYTLQFSSGSPRQIILGDPGTLFLNPSVLSGPQDVIVELGNNVPPIGADQPPRGGNCSLESRGGGGFPPMDALLLVPLWLPLVLGRRPSAARPTTPG